MSKKGLNVFAGLLLASQTLTAFATVNVYGLNQALNVKESDISQNYVLHIGAFSKKNNALNYKNHVAKMTHLDVHQQVSEKNNKPLYRLYMGPFKNASSLKKVAMMIKGENPTLAKMQSKKAISSPIVLKTQSIKNNSQSKHKPWQYGVGLGVTGNSKATDGAKVAISAVETDTLSQKSQQIFPLLNASLKREIPYSLNGSEILAGPSVYYHHMSYEGDVYQFGNPSLNNYTYKFSGHVYDVLFETDVISKAFYKNVQGFMKGGLGITYASVSYADTANSGIAARTSRSTGQKREVNFAADIGAGFMMALRNDYSARLEYLYQYRNDGKSSRLSDNQNLLRGVAGSMNTQNIMLSLHRQFN